MTDIRPPSSINRLSNLDAVRGFACLAVAGCHISSSAPLALIEEAQDAWWLPIVRFFTNGDAAVVIFFLLSGYVLALPFFRGRQPSFGRFVFKRFCRLYVPFAATIALTALAFRHVDVSRVTPDTGPWLAEHAVNSRIFSLTGHFFMIGRSKDMNLDSPIWTLIHEIRISIIFPFLLLVSRNTRTAAIAAVVTLLASIGLLKFFGGTDPWGPVDSFGISLLWTLRMIPYFFVGILLCKHSDALRARIGKIPMIWRWAILCGALIGFIPQHDYLGLFSAVSYTLYAVIVIMFPFEMPLLGKILNFALFQWIGRISYSIYLIHVPLLMVLLSLMWGHYSYTMSVLTFYGLLLVAASVMYLLIEAPAMWCGRRLLAGKRAP